MAKKTESSSVPVVTSLPLPSSDSVLVIDLPDGQKLLVGKMAAGSVIEVATWRGTGRPDSRTNRLMLGMSNGEVEETPESGTETAQTVNKLSPQYAIYLLRNIVPLIALGLQKIVVKVKSFRKSDAAIAPVRAQESSEEVQEWLNKITQSINQNKGELIKSTPKSQKGASKPKKSPSGQKSKSNNFRKGK